MWWWPAGQAGAGSGLDCPCPRGGLKAFFKSEVGVRAFFGAKSLLAKDTSPRCSGSLELDLTQPPYLHRLCPGKMAKPRSRRKTQQLPKLLLWLEWAQQSCSPSSRGGKKSGRKLTVHPVCSPSSRAFLSPQLGENRGGETQRGRGYTECCIHYKDDLLPVMCI